MHLQIRVCSVLVLINGIIGIKQSLSFVNSSANSKTDKCQRNARLPVSPFELAISEHCTVRTQRHDARMSIEMWRKGKTGPVALKYKKCGAGRLPDSSQTASEIRPHRTGPSYPDNRTSRLVYCGSACFTQHVKVKSPTDNLIRNGPQSIVYYIAAYACTCFIMTVCRRHFNWRKFTIWNIRYTTCCAT